MRNAIVRYRVKPGQEEHNEELVRAVYAELAERDPGGFHYATFRLEDGLTFVHVWVQEDGAIELKDVAAFRGFRSGLGERCEWGPEVSAAEQVGSYELFA
jgi:antibiotic biosynthesis monooxygenase